MDSAITPQMFGALANDVHDDTSAIQTAINTALQNGKNVFFPAGTYKCSSTIKVDPSKSKDFVAGTATSQTVATGIILYGEGQYSTIDFTSTSANTYVGLDIEDQTSTSVTYHYPANYFYFHLRDLQIQGNTVPTGSDPIPLVRIGRRDLKDAFNACLFTNLVIRNVYPLSGTPALTGAALEINYVLQSTFQGTFDSGGADGIRLNQAQFNTFSVSASANMNTSFGAGNCIHLAATSSPAPTQNYIWSNVFLNPDLEEGQTGVYIDAYIAWNNTFVSPYFAGLPIGYDTAAYTNRGTNPEPYNRLIQPTWNSVTTEIVPTSGNQYVYNEPGD